MGEGVREVQWCLFESSDCSSGAHSCTTFRTSSECAPGCVASGTGKHVGFLCDDGASSGDHADEDGNGPGADGMPAGVLGESNAAATDLWRTVSDEIMHGRPDVGAIGPGIEIRHAQALARRRARASALRRQTWARMPTSHRAPKAAV